MIRVTNPVFCPEFSVKPVNSAIIPQGKNYENLCGLVDDYERFCTDCERWGQTPAEVFVYYGECDKEAIGMPNYPDLIVSWRSDLDSAVVTIA